MTECTAAPRLQGRRLAFREVSRAWTAWHGYYSTRIRRFRLLQAASSRLLRPKVALTFSDWRRQWQVALSSKEHFEPALFLIKWCCLIICRCADCFLRWRWMRSDVGLSA